MMADVNSCEPVIQQRGHSFILRSLEKTELVEGMFSKGERATSKKPALPEGWLFGVFGRSFR